MNDAEVEKMRKKANTYFNGRLAPIILTIIGFFTTVIWIGYLLILIGAVWYVIDKNGSNKGDEENVDKLINYEMYRIHKRAYEKLNVIEEQVSIIDPIKLYGPADDDVNYDTTNSFFKVLHFILICFDFVCSIFTILYDRIMKTENLTNKVKIGKDYKLRYSYNQYTVYVFDKNQLYIYYANVDITTGIIHKEGTYEYYYIDIVGVSMTQTRSQKFLPAKKVSLRKKNINNIYEKIKIYTGGCYHTAAVDSDINHSLVDKQFKAMRNLIREKKRGAGLINSRV